MSNAISGSVTANARIVRASLIACTLGVAFVALLITTLPAHLPEAWKVQYPRLPELISALGSLLFGSVMTSLLYDFFLRRNQQAAAEESLRRVLNYELDKKSHFGEYGLAAISPELNLVPLIEDLTRVDTLWLLDTYDRAHPMWLEALGKALERGTQVRMMIIDPESDVAEMRALELNIQDSFKYRVNEFRRVMVGLESRFPNLNVRIYRDLPCAPMYAVERHGEFVRAFSSYFLDKPTNLAFPHFEWVAARNSFGRRFLQYMHGKWARAAEPQNWPGLPVGYWIYTFNLSRKALAKPEVYGKFVVHRDGRHIWAEGESFYIGQRPDRSTHRRGLWRSTRVAVDEGRNTLTLDYDMIIQNARDASEPRQYRGQINLTKVSDGHAASFLDCTLDGQIEARPAASGEQSTRLVGSVRAKRLRERIPSGHEFPERLKAAFERELRIQVYSEETIAANPATLDRRE